MSSFIEVRKARKSYGSGDVAVHALDGMNFTLDEGKICVILGPSGSGKSTLLNMIGGLDSLDEGTITVDGEQITGLSKKKLTDYRLKKVGFVFQFYNLIPDLTVRENVEIIAEISKDPLQIDEILRALEIDSLADRFPVELSGGQQQRASIARAMVKNPKILLCDELTGALDTKASRQVLKFIEKINQQYHTTTLIITHNEAIAGMADTIMRIKDGRVDSLVENERKISARCRGRYKGQSVWPDLRCNHLLSESAEDFGQCPGPVRLER